MVNSEDWLTLVVLAVRLGWSVATLDVKTAFLQTSLEFSNIGGKRTFLRVPHGVNVGPAKVLEVLKSIYGLRTAQSQWQATFIAALQREGFQCSLYTDCILTKVINGQPVIVITYVDDVITLGPRVAAESAIAIIQKCFRTGEATFLEDCSCLLYTSPSPRDS